MTSIHNNDDTLIHFCHVLPPSRLGQSHDTLQSFQDAIISPAYSKRSKHYTLVIVTSLHTRILLGVKQRGFGKGMYHCFGGKVEENEDFMTSACRELQEETGISATPNQLDHVGILHFSFDDDSTEMVVHVYAIDICTTENEKENISSSSSVYVHPSTIHPCDEIIPEWFEHYAEIPLNNMFADDSLWLTRFLSLPHNTNNDIWMEGYFHFQEGGQDVNTIQHYYLSFDDDDKKKKRTLEQRLFHQLHIHRIHNPNIKEFKEAFAFCKIVQKFFGKMEFDAVMDVAGGHGALAALLLITLPTVQQAIVIDPANVGGNGVERAWGTFYRGKTLAYRHECLRTALPAELSNYQGMNVLVVACHACQHLSEEVLRICCGNVGVLGAAVMPCCQYDSSPGGSWKQTCKNLKLPFAASMDLLLAGKVMGMQQYRYDVRVKMMDSKITPQNRIILCKRIDGGGDIADEKKEQAHKKLERAYQKAHEVRGSIRSTGQSLDVKSLVFGMLVGVAVSAIILSRRN